VRNRDLARAIGSVLGRPSALPVPAFVMRLALGEVADVVLASQRVLPRKALELGYRFRFPTVEAALRDLLGRLGPPWSVNVNEPPRAGAGAALGLGLNSEHVLAHWNERRATAACRVG
jgi:hypothetical protein